MSTREYTDLFNKGKTIRALRDGSLLRDFGAMPISILDRRARNWMQRKSAWKAQGLSNPMQRLAQGTIWSPTSSSTLNRMQGGTTKVFNNSSAFDPVICETMFHWFCPKGGTVIDPFAGGWTCGVVASCMGLRYVGIELNAEQVKANNADAITICKNNRFLPTWIAGDSAEIIKLIRKQEGKDFQADFMMTSPPYPGIERYSEDGRDLSTMKYRGPGGFQEKYEKIIEESVKLMKPNRFMCFHVGDGRDKDGFLFDFPHDTAAAFEAAGTKYYNDIATLDPLGPSLVRMRKIFEGSRKVMKSHQRCMIFIKGDPIEAANVVQGDTPRRANEHLKKRIASGEHPSKRKVNTKGE